MTSKATKTSAKSALKSEPPKSAEYPSVSSLGLPEHFPDAIDLRPYTPALGDSYEHHLSAALVATFARTGRPMPFVPSPEHLSAIGGHEGIGKYGVRELGVRMGEPPTEFDLNADAVPLRIEVYAASTVTEVCAAFASGHLVRVGDVFLTAYRRREEGTALTLSDGQTLTEIGDKPVHVWTVQRV